MHVILVPGLWLDASSWRDVAARLSAAGHSPHPVTLRGLHSRTADRSGVMLADHVAEIVAAIESCGEPVVLVGHAEACGLVHAAVNRVPDRVVRAVHIGGFPSADGTSVLTGCRPDAGNDLESSDDPALSAVCSRIRDNETRVVDAEQRLTDERRFDVPVTVVATEFTADDVRRWMQAGVHPAQELARIRDVTVVDLPSGRWPQIEHGTALSRILLEAMSGVGVTAPEAPAEVG
ncbi:alpha/beta hydrolase [Microbacterium sp.]|uniref:alpha/beta hydrolase n=1 Tax=Microbacterium sp. TaxID=51671 RepID=UPI0028117769|nr:alpha/beta hydrolase [Microbacterium sp.]